jgi:hypothetical protein
MFKEIGNIYLIWRKGKGERRIPIGIIKHSVSSGVRFFYNKKKVQEAQNMGFKSYEGFPDINKEVYEENVLEKFSQRLIKSERSDAQSFYNFWCIDLKHKDNDLYLLAYTQGLLPTDNFEFLTDFNPTKTLSFISEITNLTQSQLPSNILNVGDTLRYELEPENIIDNFAVKIFKDEIYLGHLKLIHNRVFHKTKRKYSIKVHAIEKNGVLKRVFVKIG